MPPSRRSGGHDPFRLTIQRETSPDWPCCECASFVHALVGQPTFPSFGMNPAQVREFIFNFDRCDAHAPLPDARYNDFVAQGRRDLLFAGRYLDQWSEKPLMEHLAAGRIDPRPHGWHFYWSKDGKITGASGSEVARA